MNQAEASGLLCADLHEINGGEESYGTECPKMKQDSSHETMKFDAVTESSTLYNDHNNANDCLDDYQHTGMMEEIQPVEGIRFDSMQHTELQSQGVSDSEEERLSSSPETSSTSNSHMPGSMVEKMQQIYNDLDEMDDKEGPVTLNPDYVMCDATMHHEPDLTFLPDGFKIEYLDWSSCEDEDYTTTVLYWEISDIISIGCKWAQNVGSATIALLVKPGSEIGNSGLVKVQFCLMDLQWPRKQQKIWHLASRYQEIWNTIPLDDFASEHWSIEPSLFFPKQYFSDTEDFDEYIYPKGEPDAVSISKRDVELLLPETFVNDTIIDFYIKYLSTRIEPSEKCRYHFFNSFFFRKLADLDKDQGRAPEGRAAFLRVRKWTRKINLFEKDFVFVPVNFNLHWSLIVICYPGEVETFEDGDTKISAKVPCILHMDSLKGSHSGLKDIIQSYLWEEWKERHPETTSDNSAKFLNLRFVSLELPQQDNSFDCGLFLLHYVEQFLMDAPNCLNPLKIDEFSSFLSVDWFPPAEASLKRSLIRKLINALVTEPSQDYPKLAFSNAQLDERHQRSENAEQEPARVFLAQSCSAGEPDSLCTILGTQPPSTSICLNDSEGKEVPASGCILESRMAPMVAAQNLQELGVCPLDKDTLVCLPSQDEKNEPPLAYSDNHFGSRSFTPEDSEVLKESACLVKDEYTHEESSLDFPDKNEERTSQQEVEVHDNMDSKCCSISGNAEVVACQEHYLERNTKKVEDEHCGASQDMHSAMILVSKDDIGTDPERITGKAEDGQCDYSEGTGSAMIGDINKDVAEHSLERITVEAEDIKHEDTLVDPIVVEETIKDDTKETTTLGEINDSEQYVSSEMNEGMTTGSRISSESKEGNTCGVMAGGGTNGTDETHAVSENAYVNAVAGDAAVLPCEADTTCTDAEIPLQDGPCGRKNKTTSENTTCDVRIPLDSTCEVTCEAVPSEADTICTDGEMSVEDDTCSGKDEITTENAACDARRPLDSIYKVTCEPIPHEDGTACTNAEIAHVDGSCSAKNEAISENTFSDAKRQLPDSTYEMDTVVSDDKCLKKDGRYTDERTERHYKRRKILLTEVIEKPNTRSSSKAPSLD